VLDTNSIGTTLSVNLVIVQKSTLDEDKNYSSVT